MKQKLNLYCLVATLLLIVSGCSSLDFRHDFSDYKGTFENQVKGKIFVLVQDQRKYVINGNKPEKFVGLIRGGFGNPWDVFTQSNNALSQDVADSLTKAFHRADIDVISKAVPIDESKYNAVREANQSHKYKVIFVTIVEWKSDTMVQSQINYDIAIDLFDENQTRIDGNRFDGSNTAQNDYLSVPKESKLHIEEMFSEVIKKILSNYSGLD